MLFSWGWTGFGQTGTGENGVGIEQGIDIPRRVKVPTARLVSVAAGNFHSACVTTDGELFTWGNARHGECGHPTLNSRGGAPRGPEV